MGTCVPIGSTLGHVRTRQCHNRRRWSLADTGTGKKCKRQIPRLEKLRDQRFVLSGQGVVRATGRAYRCLTVGAPLLCARGTLEDRNGRPHARGGRAQEHTILSISKFRIMQTTALPFSPTMFLRTGAQALPRRLHPPPQRLADIPRCRLPPEMRPPRSWRPNTRHGGRRHAPPYKILEGVGRCWAV